MKQFLAAAAFLAVTSLAQDEVEVAEAVPGSSACLYCRNQDINAGFLVSYSYCQHTDSCLMDAWNYINRECISEWADGASYPLDFCAPMEVECPEFVSSPELFQSYQNKTWSMAAGSKCIVRIDATEGVARVIFSSTLYLGIEYDAKIDDVVTIESGVTEIQIYNAAESGPITFNISFSGATSLIASSAIVAAISMLAF